MLSSNSISLHFFTNCTLNAPSTHHIEKTYESLKDNFGTIEDVCVWCDPNPNASSFDAYVCNLKTIFPKIERANSLSDGYVRALHDSTSDYMFMMEHDWIFVQKPDHDLERILAMMDKAGLWYLRFNQFQNVVLPKVWDTWYKPKSIEDFHYCETPNLSNNPHIINRKKYIELALPLIKVSKGPHGIEEKLLRSKLTGNVYGGLGHPIMIAHTNGRKKH